MPPKKKAARAARHNSTTSGDAVEQPPEDVSTPAEAEYTRGDVAALDLWTDEQETSLFKGVIRWKPVGMHKHFRMIAISESMINHGYNGYASSNYAHTRISGIWDKVGSLYNLNALNIREDVMGEAFYPFSLPNEEFGDRILASRIAPDGSSSPPSLPHLLSGSSFDERRVSRRHSTVDDTDEPRSSPASNLGPKLGRSTRTSKGTRPSHLAEVSNAEARESKASPDHATEDDQKNEEEEDEAMDEEEDNTKAAEPKAIGRTSKSGAAKITKRRSGRKR